MKNKTCEICGEPLIPGSRVHSGLCTALLGVSAYYKGKLTLGVKAIDRMKKILNIHGNEAHDTN